MKLDSERQTSYDIAYVWNVKKDTNELICRRETNSGIEKLMVTKGDRSGWGRMDWGLRIGIFTLSYMQWLAKGELLYSTENSTQYSDNLCGKRTWMRMDVCTCITESLCCTAVQQKLPQHCKSTRLHWNFKKKKRKKVMQSLYST